jgi:biopolymer transport protein ExbB/TolQ
MTPDTLVAGGATFVALATGIIGLFVAGKIVSGVIFERLAKQTDKLGDDVERMAAALETRNSIDEALIRDLQARTARRG